MNNNRRNNIKIVTFSILISLMILFVVVYIFSKGNKEIKTTKLTQLKNNTNRQMMGYIIKTENDNTVVIDGGTKDDTENLIQWINQQGGEVHSWFITHPHIDHMGAFLKIVEETEIPINHIYVTLNDLTWYEKNGPTEANEINEVKEFFDVIQNSRISRVVQEVYLDQNIEIDNLNFEIIGVKNPEIINNGNNNSSMVIKMHSDTKTVIFLADTGEESGKKLLENQSDKLKADIVQMAHHGQNGVTEDVYKAINPEICLWPTPDWLWNNDSGEGEDSGDWKTKITREWMNKLNVKKNIIGKDGDQTIELP